VNDLDFLLKRYTADAPNLLMQGAYAAQLDGQCPLLRSGRQLAQPRPSANVKHHSWPRHGPAVRAEVMAVADGDGRGASGDVPAGRDDDGRPAAMISASRGDGDGERTKFPSAPLQVRHPLQHRSDIHIKLRAFEAGHPLRPFGKA
jgi:hypothetical protein